MQKKGVELSNLSEVAAFWRSHLDKLGKLLDVEVAGSMANVVTNPRYAQWYDEGHGDGYFVKIFDLVADLEVPGRTAESRAADWDQVSKLLSEMEKIHSYKS